MQGQGTLTAYAGQTVTMSGVGSMPVRNYAALMRGAGSLSAVASQAASCLMTGSGTVHITTTAPTVGNASLPALTSIGGDYNYAQGRGYLPALFSTGEGGFYVPPQATMGYGNLPCLVSSGVVTTISTGNGDGDLPPFISLGGEGNYGVTGAQSLPTLESFGIFGTKGEAILFDRADISSGVSGLQDHIVIITETGQIVDTFSGSVEYVQAMLESLTATSLFSLIAELSGDLLSYLQASSLSVENVGDNPSLSGRVWVVNMDNFAASQYDNYGFNSFFHKDGEAYGVAADGIYRLSGKTDAGAEISGLLELGLSPYGTRKSKKILSVYLGVSNEKDLYLKVETEKGSKVFKMTSKSSTHKTQKVRIPHTVIGSHWNFTLMGDFDLSSVEFKPHNLARRM